MQKRVLERVRPTFRAVAHAVVPETPSMSAEGWTDLEATVERALASRPVAMQKQIVSFLRAVEYLPIARYGARFSRLNPERATAVLRWLERSKALIIRRGVWGLRTLVMMGYYTQPIVQQAIGYRAHRDGWSLRRRSGEFPAVADPRTTP